MSSEWTTQDSLPDLDGTVTDGFNSPEGLKLKYLTCIMEPILVHLQSVHGLAIPGGPKKPRNSQYSRFSGLCSDKQLSFFTFLLDCHFRDLTDFQSSEARLMTN